MNINGVVDKMKMIQNALLEFFGEKSDAEKNFGSFIKPLSTQEIINEDHELKALLRLINNICINHQWIPNSFSKLKLLFGHFKKNIKKYFTNSEIFELFKRNKQILLLLIEEKVMIIDEYIFSQITRYNFVMTNYCEYFQPEIKPFLTEENIEKYGSKNESLKDDEFIERMNTEVGKDFYFKRREGENDDYLCQLIRNNKIKEFITFHEQTNLSLNSYIKKSIFETNQILTDVDNTKLIEYASFYGSIDIIKYMKIKGVELTSKLWIYAIHSGNAEVIRYLEENHVSPPLKKYEIILRASIKYHHNDVSNYIIDYLMKEEDLQNNIENKYHDNLYRYAVESQNYCFFPTNMEYKNMFFYLCEFDYYTLVKLYLSEGNIDINAKSIKILII